MGREGLHTYDHLLLILTCYRPRIVIVGHSEVPEKAYNFTFMEFGSFLTL